MFPYKAYFTQTSSRLFPFYIWKWCLELKQTLSAVNIFLLWFVIMDL